MKYYLFGTVILTVAALANATEPVLDQKTRSMNLNFGIDSTDLYTGQTSFNHLDYNLRVGYNSTYPLLRTVISDRQPLFSDYNLGQSLRFNNDQVCSTLLGRGMDDHVSFKGSQSETIMFHRFNSENPNSNIASTYISKSRWKLNCESPRDNYVFELTSPTGLTFLYESNPAHGLTKYPSRIVDPNDNYIDITKEGFPSITLTTQFESIKIDLDGLKSLTTSQTIAEFEKNRNSFRVNYNEDSFWEYSYEDGNFVACNPMGLCATYVTDRVRIGANYEERVVRKIYQIPHVGTADIRYEYEKKYNKIYVTAYEPNRKVDYEFLDYTAFGSKWQNGSLDEKTISDLEGNILRTERYDHIKRDRGATGNEMTLMFGTKALLSRKTIIEYGDSGGTNTSTESYLYDDKDNLKQILYPNNTSYFYVWDYSTSVYRLDLLKEEYLQGSEYKTAFTYDDRGNIATSSVNGRTTEYHYNPDGSLEKVIDAAGNVTFYDDYEYGVAGTVVDAENRVTTREIDNGYIVSERLNGRKLYDKEYDIHGKLTKYQPGSINRAPIYYTYTYPSEGGMIVTTTTSSQLKTEHYNGLGKIFQVTEEGGNRGNGNYSGRKKLTEYYINGLEKRSTNYIGIDEEPTPKHYISYEYDAINRIRKIIPIDEGPVTYAYEGSYRIISTDANNVETEERFVNLHHHGLKLSSRKVSGGSALIGGGSNGTNLFLEYNSNGELDSVRLGNITTDYNYNTYGDVETQNSIQTGQLSYEYDANGNIIKRSINNNPELEVRYNYDKIGRILSKDFGDEDVNVYYSYDDTDFVETRSKGAFEWTYFYNEERQIVKETLKHNSILEVPDISRVFHIRGINLGPRTYQLRGTPPESIGSYRVSSDEELEDNGLLEWEFQYKYNDIGALESIIYPDGEQIAYTPNLVSQPTQAVPYVSQVHYFPNGQIKNITYANGIESSYELFENSGRLRLSSHGPYYSREYQYDPTGRLIKLIKKDSSLSGSSLVYQYDNNYQLRRVYSGQSAENGTLIGSYEYDAQGSLVRLQEGESIVELNYSSNPYRFLSVSENGETKIISVTEDGRVQVYGNVQYHYSNDELMAGYSENNSSTNVFLYDANNLKTKEIEFEHEDGELNINEQDGTLLRYTIYNHREQLLVEERADETWSNFVYLGDKLIAKRDAKYLVSHSVCKVDVSHSDRATYIFKNPVYLQISTGTPIFVGNCEIYDTWPHGFELDEGTWQKNSEFDWTYHLWIHQYEDGVIRGTFDDDFILYKAFVRKVGSTERRYSDSFGKRRYDCYNHWEIVVRKYNLENSSYVERTITDGEYHTGRYNDWYSWQPKPSFTCNNPSIDPSRVNWPSKTSLMF